MRADTPPYDNNDVRLALKYAIDRDKILKILLFGYGTIANDQPIPSFDPLYAADIPQRPYDPDRARFHLRKSGYNGSFALSASDAAFTGAVDAAVIFQASAAKAGIKIDVIREAADGYWNNVWMKKPFCASNWGGRPTADMMFSTAYLASAPWNESFWKRPEFDRILLAARSELDINKRKRMYHELEAMVVNEGAELIPCFNNFLDASTAAVHGYVPSHNYEMSGLRAPEKVWLQT
jgi:peptide/nickel transport system substrate-binding protein